MATLASLGCLLSAVHVMAQPTDTGSSPQRANARLDFTDAPFNSVVQTVADRTGQRFVVDPRVHTQVTMLSAGPLSADATLEAFNAMLAIHGFEARRVGRDLQITPGQSEAARAVDAGTARVIASSVRDTPPPLATQILATRTLLTQAVRTEAGQGGLRVYPGADAAEFDRLGLDSGDVVLAVNGAALNDPARSQEIFGEALAARGEVTVKLERSGRVQDLILYTARQ
jgi:type II secretory pathway component GspD/PulD (secretin)